MIFLSEMLPCEECHELIFCDKILFSMYFTHTHTRILSHMPFDSALASIDKPAPSPLGPHQLLLRGSLIRNTKWVVGAVVYTGAETKVRG